MAEAAKKSFHEKFLAAQAEMPKLQKDGENPHFKSQFVTLDNVLGVVLPILHKHGLALVQSVNVKDGQPVLTTAISDNSGDGVISEMLLMMKSADPQGQGSAITYARRYSLMALLGLSSGDDDDGNSANEAENHRQEVERQQTSPKALAEFLKIMKDKGVTSKEDAQIILERIDPNWKKLNSSGITRVRKELVLMNSDTMEEILKGDYEL